MSLSLVSLVPPLLGLAGGALAGFYSARAALRSWERSRQDVAAKLAVELIRDLGTELARAHHSICWLTWKARFDPEGLGVADVDHYNTEMHASLPKFSGDYTALMGIDSRAAEKVRPAVGMIFGLDARVGLACVKVRSGDVQELADLHDDALAAQGDLLGPLKDMAASVLGKRENVQFDE